MFMTLPFFGLVAMYFRAVRPRPDSDGTEQQVKQMKQWRTVPRAVKWPDITWVKTVMVGKKAVYLAMFDTSGHWNEIVSITELCGKQTKAWVQAKELLHDSHKAGGKAVEVPQGARAHGAVADDAATRLGAQPTTLVQTDVACTLAATAAAVASQNPGGAPLATLERLLDAVARGERVLLKQIAPWLQPDNQFFNKKFATSTVDDPKRFGSVGHAVGYDGDEHVIAAIEDFDGRNRHVIYINFEERFIFDPSPLFGRFVWPLTAECFEHLQIKRLLFGYAVVRK